MYQASFANLLYLLEAHVRPHAAHACCILQVETRVFRREILNSCSFALLHLKVLKYKVVICPEGFIKRQGVLVSLLENLLYNLNWGVCKMHSRQSRYKVGKVRAK